MDLARSWDPQAAQLQCKGKKTVVDFGLCVGHGYLWHTSQRLGSPQDLSKVTNMQTCKQDYLVCSTQCLQFIPNQIVYVSGFAYSLSFFFIFLSIFFLCSSYQRYPFSKSLLMTFRPHGPKSSNPGKNIIDGTMRTKKWKELQHLP